MARFWRFKSDDFPGEFIYIDPSQIIGISHEAKYDDEDRDCYVIVLAGDSEYMIRDAEEGRRLMRWAESLAETVPEVANEMAWR